MGAIGVAAIVAVAVALVLTGPSSVYILITGRIPRFPLGPRKPMPMTILGHRLTALGNLLMLGALFCLVLSQALLPNGYWAWWQVFLPAAGIAGGVIVLFAWITQRLPGELSSREDASAT